MPKNERLAGPSRADDGTRNHDLLHGKKLLDVGFPRSTAGFRMEGSPRDAIRLPSIGLGFPHEFPMSDGEGGSCRSSGRCGWRPDRSPCPGLVEHRLMQHG
jgi:hypothetical protein